MIFPCTYKLVQFASHFHDPIISTGRHMTLPVFFFPKVSKSRTQMQSATQDVLLPILLFPFPCSFLGGGGNGDDVCVGKSTAERRNCAGVRESYVVVWCACPPWLPWYRNGVVSYMNESCLWMSHVTYEWVMSHLNESCHIWMTHVTYEWVMSHMNESCHIWVSHVTYD